ncbi:MAG: prolipoprotein diacylglyceryl transferase [Bacteroidales bacterium]|jgi:prolipoprotein diacylglyceryl transferase|nr:prolipoprotein diacylglyceryl transferase [Bacteroidales bacterium]
MYPKLSDLINDIFGTNITLPIQSYGLMVALAFVVAAYLLYLELNRKKKQGLIPILKEKVTVGLPATPWEIAISVLLGFLIGWKGVAAIFDYHNFAENAQDFLLSTTGNIWGGLIVGAASGAYAWYSKKKKVLDKPKTAEEEVSMFRISGNILIIAVVFGLIGAKVFDVVEHLNDFFADPLGMFFSFSGLTFYGGLIGGTTASLIYARRKKIPILVLIDAAAPALMIAYAVGRLGCHISGDGCWGIPNLNPKPEWLAWLPDWAWANYYPHNVINEGVPIANCHGNHCFVLDQPVFPTSLYESSICIFFFIALWLIRKKVAITGLLFGIYLILNGIERYLIEGIRVNIQYNIGNSYLTQARIIALILIIVGIGLSIWAIIQYRKKKKTGINS